MPRIENVPVGDLKVDRRYQRPLNETRVKRMVDQFDDREIGVLEVSRRNGHTSVIDGQHRLAALKKLKVDKARCLVHADLSAEEEAALFVRFQLDRRNLRPWERFRAEVFAENPEAAAITQIVEGCGFTIGKADKDSHHETIEAVVALERTYRRSGAKGLRQTLDLIQRCWKGDDKSTNGYLIQGVALLLREYGDRIGPEEEARMAEVAPNVILRRALGGTGHYGGGDRGYAVVAKELRTVAGVRGRPRKFKANA